MSSLAKGLLAVLTLSVVAAGVGLASSSDEPPPDRSRPVIIGRTSDVDDDPARGGDDRPRTKPTPRQEEEPGSGPSVVTPKPRELASPDELDEAGDGEETDPGEDGWDDDTSEDVDDDEGAEGDDGGDDGGDD